jgi:hypothetical protein
MYQEGHVAKLKAPRYSFTIPLVPHAEWEPKSCQNKRLHMDLAICVS